MKKRLVGILLTMTMIVSLFPIVGSSTETEQENVLPETEAVYYEEAQAETSASPLPDSGMQTVEPEQILYTLDDGIPYVDIKENSDAQIINETGEIISYSNDVSTILFDEDNASAQTVASVELNIYSIEHARIVTGNDHTLMINSDGTVSAWGKNEYGQLGNGTTSNSFDPVQVTGLSNIVEVSAGDGYSIALDQYGDVYSWGRSIGGVLGIGNSANQYIPVKIDTLNNLNIVKISTSGYHCLALTDSGNLYAWGVGYNGQLGTGNTNFENKPTIVQNLPSIIDIGAGGFFSIAVDSAGYVWSWGNNNDCRLGFVSSGDWSLPIKTSIQNIVNIEVGYDHCLALDKSGNVYTWGANNYKQLGNDNITTYTPQKQLVQGLNNISKISTRRHFNFVQDNNENVYAWGRNDFGQLGTGSYNSNSSVPTKISGYGFETITSSIYSAFAVDSDNNLYKWGYMPYNDMSDYNKECTTVPLKIPLNTVFRQIDAYIDQTLAINDFGQVLSWGEGYYANGNDYMEIRTYPTVIDGINDPKQVSRGKNHNLVLDKNGDVWGWGSNSNNPMGNLAGKVRMATKLNNISNVAQIAAGTEFSIFLKNDGTLWGVGKNDVGQLGQGNTTDEYYPIQITTKNDFQRVSVAESYVAAIAADGVYTWGGNNRHQLGNGNNTNNSTPTKLDINLSSGEEFIDISAGMDFCLALTNLGNVYSWGDGGSGELGRTGYGNTPKQITTLSNIEKISAGKKSALAIKSDGTVYGWGYGYDGQLGMQANSVPFPKVITSLANKDIKDVTCGYSFSAALDSNGNLYTFGKEVNGHLAAISGVPVEINSGECSNSIVITSPIYGTNISDSGNVTIEWMPKLSDANIKINGYRLPQTFSGTSATINIPYCNISEIEVCKDGYESDSIVLNKKEILLYNVAYNIVPTYSCSQDWSNTPTDGIRLWAFWHSKSLIGGKQYIQLDLGKSYSIEGINIWRVWGNNRKYHDVVYQLSDDPNFENGVSTVYNNDTDNSSGLGLGNDAEYIETRKGKTLTFEPITARYVRLWSNGNTIDSYNHYSEIEVLSKEQPNTSGLNTYTGTNVTMRLEPEQVEISSLQMNRIIGDLDTAYDSYAKLTSQKPYDSDMMYYIANDLYNGNWASTGDGETIWTRAFVKNELNVLAEKNSSSFGLLHEMGHYFEYYGWNFDSEFFANFKMMYVLYDNPDMQLYYDNRYYDGNTIWEYYYSKYVNNIGNETSYIYHNDALEYCFVRIINEIGWEPFVKTFDYFIKNNQSPQTRLQRFDLFLAKLQEYYNPGGTEVYDTFPVNNQKSPADELSFIRNYFYSLDSGDGIYDFTSIGSKLSSPVLASADDDNNNLHDMIIEKMRLTGLSYEEVIENAINSIE